MYDLPETFGLWGSKIFDFFRTGGGQNNWVFSGFKKNTTKRLKTNSNT